MPPPGCCLVMGLLLWLYIKFFSNYCHKHSLRYIQCFFKVLREELPGNFKNRLGFFPKFVKDTAINNNFNKAIFLDI